MELNEIKKSLYKDNPIADLVNITKSGIRYKAIVKRPSNAIESIYFLIPFNDIGDAAFHSTEPAKYLIRWIV